MSPAHASNSTMQMSSDLICIIERVNNSQSPKWGEHVGKTGPKQKAKEKGKEEKGEVGGGEEEEEEETTAAEAAEEAE